MGIGPSTKETTLHHFRDPLVNEVDEDSELDLIGIIVAGTPQSAREKYFVGSRAAVMAYCAGAEGAIISADGWGNTDVDYENTARELGKRNIPFSGLKFIGTQARFVVTNKYLDAIVDINKSEEGIETEVVGENEASIIDVKKAIAFLKIKINRAKKDK